MNDLGFFRYSPYNPDPMALKRKTDASLQLLKKVNNMNIDNDALNPREAKAVAQVSQAFILHIHQRKTDQHLKLDHITLQYNRTSRGQI